MQKSIPRVKTEIGRYGEAVAERMLRREGLRTLVKNYRSGRYEIDLIMRERQTGTIVFVEVKARSENANALPRTAVTAKKQMFLRRAAQNYLQENGISDTPCRFDVVEVWLESERTEWICGAF